MLEAIAHSRAFPSISEKTPRMYVLRSHLVRKMNKMADFHIVLSSIFGKVKCPVQFKGEADKAFRYFNQVFHITCI